jgi:hypothetical protein
MSSSVMPFGRLVQGRSTDHWTFNRRPARGAEKYLPVTYGHGPGQVEVRVEPTSAPLAVRREGLEIFDIGEEAAQRLFDLEIAEIVVAGNLGSKDAASALQLYGEHFERLMIAREDGVAVSGAMTTDHGECPDFARGAAAEFSSRLDGQRGLILTAYQRIDDIESHDQFQKNYHKRDPRHSPYRLQLESGPTRQLFQDLGLVLPTETDPHSTVVQFDLVRVYRDGAVYSDLVHLPIEMVRAAKQQ